MRLNNVLGAAVLAAACGASPLPVHAADLSQIYAPSDGESEPQQSFEFGTGWYLRGDAGVSFEDKPKLDTTLGAFDNKATSTGYSLGLGAGYKFNSWFRADLTADFLDPYKYSLDLSCGVACVVNSRTNVWRWDGLANGYVDLGNWLGVTPYVGAGAGFSGTHQDGSISSVGGPIPFTFVGIPGGTVSSITVASHTGYQFAWAAMAGVSYSFSPHMLLDIGYRYLNLGKMTIPLFPLTSASKTLTNQQVRVGIRYMID